MYLRAFTKGCNSSILLSKNERPICIHTLTPFQRITDFECVSHFLSMVKKERKKETICSIASCIHYQLSWKTIKVNVRTAFDHDMGKMKGKLFPPNHSWPQGSWMVASVLFPRHHFSALQLVSFFHVFSERPDHTLTTVEEGKGQHWRS